MQVMLLALGGGTADSCTPPVQRALARAQCIVGAARLLQGLPSTCAPCRHAATKPQAILDALRQSGCEQAAVVYSGDTGFYSGCRSLIPLLEQAGIEYMVCPGLSSVQLLAAALHRPWQDWVLVSAHGVACNAVAAVTQGRPAFFLTGGRLGVPQLCAQLVEAGLGDLPVTVGENLSAPDQAILTGTAAQMAARSFGPLCVLLAEAAPIPTRRTPGWPDGWFVRGEGVPMTKRFVRAAVLAALAPRPEDTVWDVGAGTGSVSVELAAAAARGQVWAVECEPGALALMEQNRQKFHAWNLHLVPGAAPQALAALPAPDAVFIGGSRGQLEPILAAALGRNPQARLCIACIALETLEAALQACRAHGLAPQVVQVAVSASRPAGDLHLMMGQNPVFLVTANCDD